MRIVITGPTAVGKTDLSLKLAKYLNLPIISADSRQCYKLMDLGTGKVSADDLQKIPHYNISIFYPDVYDNAYHFLSRSKEWEKEITDKHDHVLYVGGSTLYIEALIHPFDELPASSDQNQFRLEELDHKYGIEYLFEELQKVDPEYAKKMDGFNRQRIYRALDIYWQTGKPFSSFHKRKQPVSPPSDTVVFVFNRERQELHDRINKRVDQMIDHGLQDEVKHILDLGYSPKLNALQTVGYREIISHLEGNISFDESVALIKRNTRRYARRQLTWFRRWAGVHTIPLNGDNSDQTIDFILHQLNVVADQNNR